MSAFDELMQIYAPWSKPHDDGHHPDLPMREYHEDLALGSSAVGLLGGVAGGAFYEEKYISERRQVYSEGTDLGSIAHKIVLEPDTFHEVYEVHPDGEENRQTNAWKDFEEGCRTLGKIAIRVSDLETVQAMRDVLFSHEIGRNMLRSGFTENSYFATCKRTGCREKARPDHVAFHPQQAGKFAGIDYKTTKLPGLGIKKWSNQEAGLGRHIQAAHHSDVFNRATGDKMADFYHVAQMQTPPYLVRVFRIPENWFLEGNLCRDIAKDVLMRCLETGEWPGYPVEVEDLLDPWSFNTEEM